MGLFGFLGSVFGGNAAKNASRKAESAQLAALEKAIAEQQRQYDTTRGDFAPFRDAGTTALGRMGDLSGDNGADVQQSAIDQLRESPFFQSLNRAGEEAILQTASATGGLRGGNTIRGLADFRGDLLARTISDELNRLMGTATMGMGATNSTAGFGQQSSQALSSLYGDQGQVRAGGLLTRGGITNGTWNNLGSFLDRAASAGIPKDASGILKALGKIF